MGINQKMIKAVGTPDKSESLSGAFAKGSVEANRILTQTAENKPAQETADNTKLTAELIKKMLDGGVPIKNVAVAN